VGVPKLIHGRSMCEGVSRILATRVRASTRRYSQVSLWVHQAASFDGAQAWDRCSLPTWATDPSAGMVFLSMSVELLGTSIGGNPSAVSSMLSSEEESLR